MRRSSGFTLLEVMVAMTITGLALGSLFSVIAGNKRLARFPDVPTIAETLPGVEVDAWLGLFLPAGSPKELVAKINADVTEVLNIPETRTALSNQGIEVAVESPEALATLMRNDFNRWGRVIREANIKAD